MNNKLILEKNESIRVQFFLKMNLLKKLVDGVNHSFINNKKNANYFR
jgi:hypothetical protein